MGFGGGKLLPPDLIGLVVYLCGRRVGPYLHGDLYLYK